ncbi:MAG TPA: ABC transporter substrate-binding protein [Chloroflexota bacterium]|jgi:NitT/TauT family transport system substrate-binding protein|nr:ABC transporter substrate-binding protein [Chloroflexota bacterium]
MTTRTWLSHGLIALFIGACAAPAAPSAPSATAVQRPLAKITASYSERVGNYLPLWLAADQGIFKKHGLDVDLQLIPGTTGMSALLSGQVQIAQIGGSEVVSAQSGGSDLVMSGNLGSVLPYVFIVTPEIQTVNDLKGKQIGISTVGGSADIATRLSMRHFGLDPDKDVAITAMGSLQNRTAGLQNGAIQAAPANPPDSLILQRQGFHVLFDIAQLGFPAASATIVAQRSWVNEHKDLFQAWNDAVVESIALAKQNPDLGLPLMKQYMQSEDDELMRQTYDYWINEVLKLPPSLSPDQFEATVAALAVTNPKVKDVKVDQMIDGSFVQNAMKNR